MTLHVAARNGFAFPGADSRSRVIDLPGGARFLRRVDFRYGNLVAGAQAKVELWAR